ncbi:MAG: SPASM domain-containing protein, partial [Candidatus Heimdallarchaeaceae archaeon]
PVYLQGARLNELSQKNETRSEKEISTKLKRLATFVEPCESGLFSLYCNVDGLFYPCSFVEDEKGWKKGLELKEDFLKDVWYHPRMVEWRKILLETTVNCECQFQTDCRTCPIYDLVECRLI